MENELTLHSHVPYSVKRETMDQIPEQQEGQGLPQPAGRESLPKNLSPQEALQQKVRVDQEWNDYVMQRQAAGEPLTKEEFEMIQRAKAKGEGPITLGGGSSDGSYENFDVENYAGTNLENLAKEVQKAGRDNKADEDFLNSVRQRVQNLVSGGHISKEAQDAFLKELDGVGLGAKTPAEALNAAEEPELTPEQRYQAFLQKNELLRQKKEKSTTPQSLQEVVFNIVNDEGEDRWGPAGKYPLLVTKEDHDRGLGEVGSINKANFLRWVRERMLYHHFSNSRDYQLNLLGSVGIDNEYGSKIPIVKMTENRQQYFRDEIAGEVLDDLADQCLTEVWLFGKSRNNDLVYQLYMGSDSKLPEFLSNVHQNEEFTSGKSLERIMTMSDGYDKDKRDTKVGDVVRKAYEIYYYISDYDKLKEMLGADSPLFKRSTFEDAYRIILGKQTGDPLPQDAKDRLDKIFDANGNAKPKEFIDQMNPFNAQNKARADMDLMREAIRRTLSERYGMDYGLNEDPNKFKSRSGKEYASQRELVRTNLVYAEWWAWTMSRWTGAAARNDTSAIGFDAFTKTTRFRDYRVRQSAASRAGQFGNEYDLPVFKSLTRDFFNGIFVEKKLGQKENITPFEVFEMMDDIEGRGKAEGWTDEQIADEKKKVAERLRFEQFTQIAYAANHVNRAYEIFHSSLGAEEMRLEEIVKWDPFRGLILDRGKFEEQIKEKFLKPMRYAFSTYAQLDFGKMTRVQDGLDKKTGAPKYKDVTVAEAFFGPEVLNDLRPMAEKYYKKKLNKNSLTPQEQFEGWRAFLSDDKAGRPLLWKRAAMARMALHIKSHRQLGQYSFMSKEMINLLYDALKTIKEVELTEGDEATDMRYTSRFLTDEDIAWIRKMSGTTQRSMMIKETLPKGGLSVAKGIWEGANDFFKYVFK